MGFPSGRSAGPLGQALAVGFLFPASIVAGFLGGRWLGRLFGWGETAAYAGAAIGVVGGFYNLFEFARRLDRRKGADP